MITHHKLTDDTGARAILERRLDAGKCAVVTLVYKGHEASGTFAVGAQNLGYSLLRSNTRMKMVSLVTEHVSEDDRSLLTHSGWNIVDVVGTKNPNSGYQSRLDFIFTKLNIFGLQEYDRIVYLDADTQVFGNIDHLCTCNAVYCAVVRNIFFNAGVLVVTPSSKLLADMQTKISSTHSYTGGDQGFLNNYFWNPERCPFYEPLLDLQNYPDTDVPYAECYRIPGYYNGDIGVNVARGDHWQFDPLEERQLPLVIHYTMAILKPWDWWSYMLVTEHWRWWDVYAADSQTTLSRYLSFAFLISPIAMYWALNAFNGFHFPHLSVVGYSSLLTASCLSSHWFRFVFAFFSNLVCMGAAFYYSNIVFVQPWFNLVLFLTTYYTFFDLFCLQITNWIFHAISISINPMLGPPSLASPIQIQLPSSVWIHRLATFIPFGLILWYDMTGWVSLYLRGFLTAVVIFLQSGLGHCLYIASSYSHMAGKR